jgi:nucleoid-associated protein YgaU
MRYFLIALLLLCGLSFGLMAQEEEVMDMGEEAMTESLAEQKWTPAEADSIINALTMEEEALSTQLAELQEQIDALQADVSSSETQIAELEAEKAELEEKLEMISWYKVKSGDYLCKIAESSEVYGYGKYARWQDIYNANKDKISNPNLIRPGTKLFIPRP